MKNRITLPLLLILIMTVANVGAQDYYWSANKKITLNKDLSGLIFNIPEKSNQELLLASDGRIELMRRINPNTIFVKIKTSVQITLKSFDEKFPKNTTIYKTLLGNEMLPTGYILLKPKKRNIYCKNQRFSGIGF